MELRTLGQTDQIISLPIVIFRCLLAVILAAHGWARLYAGGVEPFGGFLDAQGFLFGYIIAWGITLFEISGTPILALGRFVPWLTGMYAAVYAVGIVLVHAPEGWFVVGLGRNGMEYSVLLISSLLLVGVNHMPTKKIKPHSDGAAGDTKETDN